MKTGKKVLSLILAIIMCLGLLPTSALAEEIALRHEHNEDGWVCDEHEVSRTLICEEKESDGHEHTEDCYDLVCGLEECEGHTHDDACYEVERTLDCDIEEHVHDDGCYDDEGELICDVEEHEHDDDCWSETEKLVCELEESEGHTHDGDCYSAEPVCGLEEIEGHKHTDECYEIEYEWHCEAPEDEEPSEELEDRVVEAEVDGLNFSVSGMIPGNATLEVVKASKDAEKYLFGLTKLTDLLTDSTTYTYDIRLMVDGEEWEPEEEVTVSIEGMDTDELCDLSVYHFMTPIEAIEYLTSSSIGQFFKGLFRPGTFSERVKAIAETIRNGALEWEDLSSTVSILQNGAISFKTRSFSTYAVTSNSNTIPLYNENGILIYWQRTALASGHKDVKVTIKVDLDPVVNNQTFSNIPLTAGRLYVKAPGYEFTVTDLNHMTCGWIADPKNPYYEPVLNWNRGENYGLTINLAKDKSHQDIRVGDYGVFHWKKDAVQNCGFPRILKVYVNGKYTGYSQEILTPKSMNNGDYGNEYWFTVDNSEYMRTYKIKPESCMVTTDPYSDVELYLTTRCKCGYEDTCTCAGGCSHTHDAPGPDCTTLGATQFQTGYGILEYKEPTYKGYKLFVNVFVNGNEVFRTADAHPDGLRVKSGENDCLNFYIKDGYYYYSTQINGSGYDFDTKSDAGVWLKETGYLSIPIKNIFKDDESRNYDNTLNIYLCTFENRVRLDITRLDSNSLDHLNGVWVKYKAWDPKEGQDRIWSYYVPEDHFATHKAIYVPKYVDIVIEGDCDPGWEVDYWYCANAWVYDVTLRDCHEDELLAMGMSQEEIDMILLDQSDYNNGDKRKVYGNACVLYDGSTQLTDIVVSVAEPIPSIRVIGMFATITGDITANGSNKGVRYYQRATGDGTTRRTKAMTFKPYTGYVIREVTVGGGMTGTPQTLTQDQKINGWTYGAQEYKVANINAPIITYVIAHTERNTCPYEHEGEPKGKTPYKTDPATCTEPGHKYWRCDGCGYTWRTVIPKLGHLHTAVWQYKTNGVVDENYHWRICGRDWNGDKKADCSAQVDKEKHSFTTTTSGNSITYTCKCGYTKTVTGNFTVKLTLTGGFTVDQLPANAEFIWKMQVCGKNHDQHDGSAHLIFNTDKNCGNWKPETSTTLKVSDAKKENDTTLTWKVTVDMNKGFRCWVQFTPSKITPPNCSKPVLSHWLVGSSGAISGDSPKYESTDGSAPSSKVVFPALTQEKNVRETPLKLTFTGTPPTPATYSVTYDLDGGTLPDHTENWTVANQVVGNLVSNPGDPSKEGYNFLYWYRTDITKASWDFDVTGMPSKNITLKAEYEKISNTVSITFIDKDGETVLWTGNLETGSKVPSENIPTVTPPAYTAAAYDFCWNTKKDGSGSIFDPANDAVNDDTVVYACFTPKSYAVNYWNDGVLYWTEQVKHGEYATGNVTDPTKPDFAFLGWELRTDKGDLYNFYTPVTASIDLDAMWKSTKVTYTLTYNMTSSSTTAPVDPEKYLPGQVASLVTENSADLTHQNVDLDGTSTSVLFVGWSLTDTDDRIFARGEYDQLPALLTGTVPMNGNTTVYAVWGYDTDPGPGPGPNPPPPIPDVLEATLTVLHKGYPLNEDGSVSTEATTIRTDTAIYKIGAKVEVECEDLKVPGGFEGWTHKSDDPETQEVTIVPTGNTATFWYDQDQNDDDIPDKYQKAVTLKVNNGYWTTYAFGRIKEKDDDEWTSYLTFYKDGQPSNDPTAEANVLGLVAWNSIVGLLPKLGFMDGYKSDLWSAMVGETVREGLLPYDKENGREVPMKSWETFNNAGVTFTNPAVYTYGYEKIKIEQVKLTAKVVSYPNLEREIGAPLVEYYNKGTKVSPKAPVIDYYVSVGYIKPDGSLKFVRDFGNVVYPEITLNADTEIVFVYSPDVIGEAAPAPQAKAAPMMAYAAKSQPVTDIIGTPDNIPDIFQAIIVYTVADEGTTLTLGSDTGLTEIRKIATLYEDPTDPESSDYATEGNVILHAVEAARTDDKTFYQWTVSEEFKGTSITLTPYTSNPLTSTLNGVKGTDVSDFDLEAGNGTYYPHIYTFTAKYLEPKPIIIPDPTPTDTALTSNGNNYTVVYDGQPHTIPVPSVKIKNADNTYTALNTSDYTLTWPAGTRTGTDVDTYTATVKVEKEGYEPAELELTLTITHKPLIVSATATDRYYTAGNKTVTVTLGDLTGTYARDNVTLNKNTTGTIPNDAAGTYPVTVTVPALTGTGKANYTVSAGPCSVTIYNITVTFDPNGGTLAGDTTKPVIHGNTYGTLPTPTRDYYDFAGWFTASTGGTQVTAETVYTADNDQTLYAHWTPTDYTITFNANNGTLPDGTTNPMHYNIESATIDSLPTPTRTGYTFNGWKDGGTTVTSIPTGSHGNKTLVAQWTANSYTLTYDANQGTLPTGTDSTKTISYDDAYGTLPAATRTGYTLTGWFTAPTGGAQVNATDKYQIAGNQTIYAQWQIVNYGITYDLTGGQWPESYVPTTSYNVTTAEITLPTNPTRTGYTFNGWNTAEDGDGATMTSIPAGSTGDVTVYAQWTANSYTVKFEGQTGVTGTAPGNITVAYDEEKPLPAAGGFAKTGYHQTGWVDASDSTKTYALGGIIKNLTAENGATITMNPVWEANTYTVKFEGQTGVTGTAPNDMTFTYDAAQKLPGTGAFSKTGYHQTGWAVKGNEGTIYDLNGSVENLTDVNGGVVTLVPVWAPNVVKVTFDPNGGDELAEGVKTKDVSYDTAYGELPTPVWNQHIFKGWNTEQDGTGDNVTAGTVLSITDATQTLYAQWDDDALADPDEDEDKDPTNGDNIPDQYQKEITFQVVGGVWSDSTSADKKAVVTFKDADGNWTENGTATLSNSKVPALGGPVAGYVNEGAWAPALPTESFTVNDFIDTHVYTYLMDGIEIDPVIPEENDDLTYDGESKTYTVIYDGKDHTIPTPIVTVKDKDGNDITDTIDPKDITITPSIEPTFKDVKGDEEAYEVTYTVHIDGYQDQEIVLKMVIKRAELTVEITPEKDRYAVDTAEKTINVTVGKLTGVVGEDDVYLDEDSIPTTGTVDASKPADEAVVTPSKTLELTGAKKNNYTLKVTVQPVSIHSITIIPEEPDDEEKDKGMKKSVDGDNVVYTVTYDGTEHTVPVPSVIVTDKDGNDITAEVGYEILAKIGEDVVDPENLKVGPNAGTYEVYYTVVVNGEEFTIKATVVINKRPITITAGSQTTNYGVTAQNNTASITAGSLAQGDTLASVTVTGSQASAGSSLNVPSNAQIVKNGTETEVTANYTITYRNGTLTMNNRPYTPPVNDPTPTPPIQTPNTNIEDEDVPLANVEGLNTTDHYAYLIGSDGKIRPTAEITRAEVATIFFRLMTPEFRSANWATTNSFTDTDPNAWYNNAVSTCVKAGIITGYTDGTYRPDNKITRAEFAAIAARFATLAYDGVNRFDDVSDDYWAVEEINTAALCGWIDASGKSFRPLDNITRAEVVKIINYMLDRIPDKDNMLDDMIVWPDNMDTSAWYYEMIQEATNTHNYEWDDELGLTEIWTELLENPDWAYLEKQWADPNQGPSIDVMHSDTKEEDATVPPSSKQDNDEQLDIIG